MVTDRRALNNDLKHSYPSLDLILILNYNRSRSKRGEKKKQALIPVIPLMAWIFCFSALLFILRCF